MKTYPINSPKTVTHDERITVNQTAGAQVEATPPSNPSANLRPVEIRLVQIEDLHPHQLNAEIYGDTADEGLIESIKVNGVLQPLLATPQNLILGGHRRYEASRKAGLTEVPVIAAHPEDESAAIEMLVAANTQRVKTNEQVAREAYALMRIEQERARRRQGEAAKGKPVPAISPELDEPSGDARKIVADKLNIGIKKVDQALAIVAKLDQLEAGGDTEQIDDLRHRLNQSVHRAFQKVKALNRPAPPSSEPASLGQPVDGSDPARQELRDLVTRVEEKLIGYESWPIERLRRFDKALTDFLGAEQFQGKEAA